MDIAIRNKMLDLLEEHRIMTVATLRPDGWPQATTVGYVNKDLTLYFLCGPESQKANNLLRYDRISLTIDHDTPELMAITGLSMAARARVTPLLIPCWTTRRDSGTRIWWSVEGGAGRETAA